MALSLYQTSVPMMIKSLENLLVFLKKAEEHCSTKGMKQEEMIQFRLVEDMRGLDYQVQSCSNTAKFLAHRVGGHENIVMEDNEKTFDELNARVKKTIDILKAVPKDSMDGKEDAEILMETGSMGTLKFNGLRYVSEFAVPNFHFHLASGYCILRHLGVNVGAMDYLDTQKDLFVKA